MIAPGDHNRLVNGILGLLCRTHFPGMVTLAGVREPAYTWAHYKVIPDFADRDGRVYANLAERVTAELWVSFPSIAQYISFFIAYFSNNDCTTHHMFM